MSRTLMEENILLLNNITNAWDSYPTVVKELHVNKVFSGDQFCGGNNILNSGPVKPKHRRVSLILSRVIWQDR